MSRRNGMLTGLMLLFLLLPSAALLGFATRVHGAENEMMPPGAWLLRTGYGQDDLTSSIATDNNERPLKNYLVPKKSTHDLIEGKISRTERWWEVLLGMGLTEDWNLQVQTAYRSIEQSSTLSTSSSDATAQAEVARLIDRSESGLGDITLTALYRVTYTDRRAFRWGLAATFPGSSPTSPYAGRGTLYVSNPFTEASVFLHSTTYGFTNRARFDFNLRVGMAEGRILELASGGEGEVHPGSFGALNFDVEHNLGAFFYGLGLTGDFRGETTINGVRQGDPVQVYLARLQLGGGNLDQLEQAPIDFPYQVLLRYDQVIQGFNTPLHNSIRLLLETYF